jgi:hypothetical protein
MVQSLPSVPEAPFHIHLALLTVCLSLFMTDRDQLTVGLPGLALIPRPASVKSPNLLASSSPPSCAISHWRIRRQRLRSGSQLPLASLASRPRHLAQVPSSRGSFLHPSSIYHGLSLTFYDGQRPTNSWLPGLALIPHPSQVMQPSRLAAFLCNIALTNMSPMTPLGLTTTVGILGLSTSTPRASP